MSTDKESSAAGTDNRPPMLVESDYESWRIRIERYIRGKPLGKLIWRSIQNGPTPHPQITVTEGQGEAAVQVTRDKRDEEFTEIENNKELADIQATNILSQGLPRHVFNILNQTHTGKEIWDNVELLMKGNESIHDYFVRFHKLINDIKITQLDILTHQMNTKFVNNLPLYWAKYVTNVKNNKDISATTYVELYTYLKSYEPHPMKTLKKQEQSTSIVDPLAYLAQTTHYHAPTQTTTLPPPQYRPLTSSTPQQVPQSSNDAVLATMNQIRSPVDRKGSDVTASCECSSQLAYAYIHNLLGYVTFRCRRQVLWLPTEEIASLNSNPPKPVTPFVHTRPTPKKDICSIVLASDIVVPPSSNCLCEELRSNCDREHSKVVELEAEILKKQQMLNESEKRCAFIEKNHVNLQVKFQKYKECLQNQRVCDNSNSTASNEIFEINKLKDQLQGKDDTIRNLQTQINITRMLNVGSTVGSFDKQALETELTQLKDAITSVRIQNDGFKVENENVKRHYQELPETNTHLRDALTGKITSLTAKNAKLKTELINKISSVPIASEKPKVLAPGMYAISPKYIPPQIRVNRAVPTLLPKKQQVTFQEPPKPSNRPT
ncbi:hypothetical protein Tco_0368481 [Tanacetum coccineum]